MCMVTKDAGRDPEMTRRPRNWIRRFKDARKLDQDGGYGTKADWVIGIEGPNQ